MARWTERKSLTSLPDPAANKSANFAKQMFFHRPPLFSSVANEPFYRDAAARWHFYAGELCVLWLFIEIKSTLSIEISNKILRPSCFYESV